MSTSLQNSIWPNTDGNLGNIKAVIPSGIGEDKWPTGDALVHNFVFDNGKLVGFVDTKALIANESKSTTFPYDYVNIQVDKSLEGVMTFNQGERTKYLTITYSDNETIEESFDYVIIDFTTTDQATIDAIRSAYKVVNKKMYAEDGSVIGTWDTSKLEVGGVYRMEPPIFVDSIYNGYIRFPEGSNTGTYIDQPRITEFNSDLSSLRDATMMFAGSVYLTSFNSNLNSLSDGFMMFIYCYSLTSFSSDLSSLINGTGMFSNTPLASFTSDLNSLIDGSGMFFNTSLKDFYGNLSSLLTGYNMFKGDNVKLTTESIMNIADSIRDLASEGLVTSSDGGKTWTVVTDEIWDVISNSDYRAKLYLNYDTNEDIEEIKAHCNKIVARGWTVYLNGSGSSYYPTDSIATTDENGIESTTPIPYYAKPVPATEETASYVDANGNFYNILGAQFIYGDDLSTYGMFTCEEDAAVNMGLTKINHNFPLIGED